VTDVRLPAQPFRWIRYLVEIRTHSTAHQDCFVRELLGWELSDGIIARPLAGYRDEVGYYAFFETQQILNAFPAIEPSVVAEGCPYVGPCRGFFGWIMVDRVNDAKLFGMDAGRAGRGLVIDLGAPQARRATPIQRQMVALKSREVSIERLGFLPDVEAVLKHSSDVLLNDDVAYLEHVRNAMQRFAQPQGHGALPLDRRKRGVGKSFASAPIRFWQYVDRSGASNWFE